LGVTTRYRILHVLKQSLIVSNTLTNDL